MSDLAPPGTEDRFRLLAEAFFEGIAITEHGILLDCNIQMAQLFGYPRAELLGRSVIDFVAPEHRALVAEAMRAGGTGAYEHDMLNPHRGRIPVEVRARQATIDGRNVRVTAVRDISARRAAETAAREGVSRLESIFRAAPTGIGIVADRLLIEVNDRVCAMTGYTRDELVGRNSRVLYPTEEEWARVGREKYDQIRRTGLGTVETHWLRRDGAIIDVLLSSSPIDLEDWAKGVTFTALDITERKRESAERDRLREQLAQAQKMESIGRLAGGIAHDFNNMLQAILGNVTIALEEVGVAPRQRESLLEIQAAAVRSADLTRQLLAFARKQTVAPQVLDLNVVIEGMLKMLQRLMGERIALDWHPAGGVRHVRVDPGQIDQVLANLVVNARDAIDGQGRIAIAIASVNVAASPANPERRPGEFVCLSVRDDGCGMDRETARHAFEPFFTTKGPGRGTGLGLATVYRIATQNGGFVDVQSSPGQGTTVRVYFPPAAAEETPGDAPSPSPTVAAGTETLLVVEDEALVLRLVRSALTRSGYTVLSAATPGDALELMAGLTSPVHLVITDVVLPEMNGRELLDRLRVLRPGLPCLFVSGYTSDIIAKEGVLDAGVHFLQKPFHLSALVARVRQVLDGA